MLKAFRNQLRFFPDIIKGVEREINKAPSHRPFTAVPGRLEPRVLSLSMIFYALRW